MTRKSGYMTIIQKITDMSDNQMENDAKATNTDNTASCGYTVLPTVLSLEEILRDVVRRQATYQVQFADYDLNTWTVPCILTQNRMDMLLTDGSIRKVRLELEM